MDDLYNSLNMFEKFLIFGLGVGVICGVITLIFGLKQKQKKLAYLGFALCIVGGCALGAAASIPLAIIFIVFSWTKGTKIDFEDEEDNEQ